MRLTSLVLFVALCALLPRAAGAASFKTYPLKLFLDARAKTGVFKVINEGDDQVTIQLTPRLWTQDTYGEDVYEDTGDILLFPRIVNIEAKGEKTVRIGYNGVGGANEKSYRIAAQELPLAKPGESALRFVLTISVPLFVKPLHEQPLEWHVDGASLAEERLAVKIGNRGNRHVQVGNIDAVLVDAAGREVLGKQFTGWYVLPGSTKTFALPIPRDECLKARSALVKAHAGNLTQEFTLPIDASMCTPRPEIPRAPENPALQGEHPRSQVGTR